MRKRENRLIVGFAAGVIASASAAAWGLPAFPGAEGFGSDTPGGRGGRVIAVTTLADSGPGSLREAVTAKGPRIVVFRVAGEIPLKSHLRITEPFITIAGQTAPGTGITLRDAGLYVQTHDVVIRFIRSRVGPSLVEEYDTQDALQISSQDGSSADAAPYNVVVDHCSFSWSIDECVGVRGPAHDVTLSWNIISEALREPFTKGQIGKERSHSMAVILGGEPNRCTLHHNLLANCNSRNPRIQGGRHAILNNVVYDWGWLTGTFSRNPEVNFIGNYYKPGPASQALKAITEEAAEMGRIYVKGNRSEDRPDDSLPQWDLIVNAPAEQHQATEPFDMAPVTISSAAEAYDAVLRGAGATLPGQDQVDRRVVRQVRLSMGGKIDRPDDVGGYPKPQVGEPPADADGDGMPDDWERAQGFNPQDAADGPADADGDGYTNLEEYLEDLVAQQRVPRPDFSSLSFADACKTCQLTCDGVEIPIVRVGSDRGNLYAHAWIEGELTLQLESFSASLESALLGPPRCWEHVTRKDKLLTFRVTEEGPRVIRLGESEDAPRLALFLDAFPERPPHPADANVIDATRFGVVSGRLNATLRLQAALDAAASQPGGGMVFVPTGHHEVSMLRIPSHVTLYLARSAEFYANGEKNDGGTILFDGVEDAGLAGPGVIDGRGSDGVWAIPTVMVRNSKSIRIEDVVLRDPSDAGIQLTNSDKVAITRAKVVAGRRRPGTGGLLINGSRAVTCERCFFSGTGHAVTIESADQDDAKNVDDVAIHETVLVTDKAGIAVGPRTSAPISNILVHDVDIVSATQGISIAQRDAGGIENLTFRDMNIELHASKLDWRGGRPFVVVNDPRGPAGPLRNILFERIHTNAIRNVHIAGTGDASVEDVKVWGVHIAAEKDPAGALRQRPPLFFLQRVRGAQLRFLYVTWPPDKDLSWDKLLDADQVDGLAAPENEIFETITTSTGTTTQPRR